MLKRLMWKVAVSSAFLVSGTLYAAPACESISADGSTAYTIAGGVCEIVFTSSVISWNESSYQNTIQLHAFDPTWGTLVARNAGTGEWGIQTNLATTGNITVSVTNTSATQNLNFWLNLYEDVTLNGPGALSLNVLPGVYYGGVGDYRTLAAGQTWPSSGNPNSSASENYFAPNSEYGLYSSSSYVDFDLSAYYYEIMAFRQTWHSDTYGAGGTATASVTYRFLTSDVPEPLTMALLGSGLLLIGVFGRRRLVR